MGSMERARGVRPVRVVLTAALALFCACAASEAQKTDVVVLENGDRITGEVKSYGEGRLVLDTSSAGFVKIKWNKIASIQSDKTFELETVAGIRYYGSLAPSEVPGKFVIVTDAGGVTLDFFDMFLLAPLYQTFWRRWDGNLDLGFNYTQSSNLVQLTLNANGIYRRPKYALETKLSVTYSQQQGVVADSRFTYSLDYFRFLSDRWFILTGAGLDRNIQLGLKLRVLAGVGGGRNLIQTNQTMLSVYAGATGNHEQPVAGEGKYNAEALVGGSYSYFMYDFPKLTLAASLDVYPSITVGGRVRLEASAYAKREIASDFYVSISIFDSFDNKDPSTGLPKNDWGPTVSVGWQF
jgi:hypothetical protein